MRRTANNALTRRGPAVMTAAAVLSLAALLIVGPTLLADPSTYNPDRLRLSATPPAAPSATTQSTQPTAQPSTTQSRPGHWSFQPVRRPPVPQFGDDTWVRTPIDAFILRGLERQGLKPANVASKYTFICRATLGLTGLPPTPDEIVAFIKDKSPDAYDKLIDRLLASPHYGERWGRHWLDVARYVPGKVKVLGIDRVDMAADYRDYVVRAFNEDKPYDRFITEQLAGDLLPPSPKVAKASVDDPISPQLKQAYFDQLIAPAFLSIGDWFDECTDPNKLRLDIIDEQMTTMGKAFLGVNFNCARCHDHKFDPIPTRDYYALAGIFRSTRITSKFSEFWRDGRPRLTRELGLPRIAESNQVIRALLEEEEPESARVFSRHLLAWGDNENTKAYARAIRALPKPTVVAFEAEQFAGVDNIAIRKAESLGPEGEQDAQLVYIDSLKPLDRWVKYEVAFPIGGTYDFELRLASGEPAPIKVELNGKVVAESAAGVATLGKTWWHFTWASVGRFEIREGLNFLRIRVAKGGPFPAIDKWRFVRHDENARRVAEYAKKHDLNEARLRDWLVAGKYTLPTPLDFAKFHEPMATIVADRRESCRSLRSKLVDLPTALSVRSLYKPINLPIHTRGMTYATAGDPVPRGVPSTLAPNVKPPVVPDKASGRLQLAQWITHKDHPLTARVMVNRIWAWHFGRGLVETTSDFGTQGAKPSHPELLDWLAAEFVSSGWSVKHIHRLIMRSNVYRLSSRATETNTRIDPSNKAYWRWSPRRLEAEAVYDAMLMSTGAFEPQKPGAPLDVDMSSDRALYVLTSGRSPAGLGDDIRKMLTLFDFDDTGTHVEKRDVSQTPAQALFFLNNPLPGHFAERFAQRLLALKIDDRRRAKHAYFVAFSRPASEAWVDGAVAYVEGLVKEEALSRQAAWARLGRALYSANAFRYLD